MPSNTLYDTKRAALTTLLNDHNKALGKKGVKLDTGAIMAKLLSEGGTNLPGLRSFERQDFIDFGFPRALASQAVALLPKPKKGEATPAADDGSELTDGTKTAVAAAANGTGPTRVLMLNAADQALEMPIAELVGAYDPNSPDNYIGAALRARSGGKPFLIWAGSGGTQLDRRASAEYLQDIVDDVPVVDFVTIDGEAYEPLAIGVRPNAIFDENPVLVGEILRKGSVCGFSNANWGGIPHVSQQFVRVLISRRDLKITSPKEVHELVRQLRTETGFDELKSMYPAAAAAFRAMTPEERPSLKVRRTRAASASPAGVSGSGPFAGR